MTASSLHQIELACPESCAVMSLLACAAAVAQVQLLDWLVSARDLRELALVSYSVGSQISLSSNVGQGGLLALSHTFHRLGGVFFAERTVSVKLFWHLHSYHLLNVTSDAKFLLRKFLA